MFSLNSYINVNKKIRIDNVSEVLNNLKNSNIVLVQYGDILNRIYGSNLNFVIAKYEICLWFDPIDEMEISLDQISLLYTNEDKNILKIKFYNDYTIIIEKI